jgi:hypothetical protein
MGKSEGGEEYGLTRQSNVCLGFRCIDAERWKEGCTSARTAIVSLLTSTVTHQPLLTHKTLPPRTQLPPPSSPSTPFSQTLSLLSTPNHPIISIEYP